MSECNLTEYMEVEAAANRKAKMLEVLRSFGVCQYSLASALVLTVRLLLPTPSRDTNTRRARNYNGVQSSACAARHRPNHLGRCWCKCCLARVPSNYGKSLPASGHF